MFVVSAIALRRLEVASAAVRHLQLGMSAPVLYNPAARLRAGALYSKCQAVFAFLQAHNRAALSAHGQHGGRRRHHSDLF